MTLLLRRFRAGLTQQLAAKGNSILRRTLVVSACAMEDVAKKKIARILQQFTADSHRESIVSAMSLNCFEKACTREKSRGKRLSYEFPAPPF
jgi:hypothetical protein